MSGPIPRASLLERPAVLVDGRAEGRRSLRRMGDPKMREAVDCASSLGADGPSVRTVAPV